MWALLLMIATTALFALSISPALLEWLRGRDLAPLGIDPTHAGHTAHFAERFRRLVDEGAARPGSEWLGPLVLPDGTAHPGELRFRGSVTLGARARLGGALVDGDLVLGPGGSVALWAHARRIQVGANAALEGRVSAEVEVALLAPCRFTRVSAPTISFGPRAPAADAAQGGVTAVRSTGERRLSPGDLVVPPHGSIPGDLVVMGDLALGPGSEVAGSAKAHGRIRVGAGVTVGGALVAVGSVEIGADCALEGPVISEREVRVGGGTRIGTVARPTTVSAPRIRVDEGAELHGTLWARERGDVVDPREPTPFTSAATPPGDR
jgi:cytoskeletal protein CcmA (bactofilin family)